MSLAETASGPAIARNLARKLNVTGIVRTAIEAMVWDGLPRRDAAAKAGISEHGLYKALRKPPVKAFYLSELQVLRESERARNIHTLVDVRDQITNQMARVAAVKALEQLDEVQQAQSGLSHSPGVTIVIRNEAPTPPTIDVTPNGSDA